MAEQHPPARPYLLLEVVESASKGIRQLHKLLWSSEFTA